MTRGEIISLGVNVVLVLITGVYAYFTYRILKANQQVAKEMSSQKSDMLRPIVSVAP